MNIWAWLEKLQEDLRASGNERTADLIDQLVEHVSENRPEMAEAVFHEALAAARNLRNPWLEVYLRHWGMQNRMNNLAQGEVALGEATALLEFAHRPETIDCPQAICVTHDISICYGNVDGPGWADECLAVCEETLARMTPEWPCYDCLSREYAGALVHQGKAEQAVLYLEQQAQKIEAAQGEAMSSRYQWQQAEALWAAGRPEEALARFQAIEKLEDYASDDDATSRAIDQAWLLAELGQIDAALELMPAWDDIDAGDYHGWAQASFLLARALPERNNWNLARCLQTALDYLIMVGAHRKAFKVAEIHAQLAIARHAKRTAELALAAAEACLPKLRKPLDAPERLANLRAELAEFLAASLSTSSSTSALPVAPEELLDYLQDQEERNPEQELDWLLAAHAASPNDQDLAMQCAVALDACGLTAAAQEHLWQVISAHPDWRAPAYSLLNHLLDASDTVGLNRLTTLIAPTDPANAHWILARQAFTQKNWDKVGEHAKQLLALENDPDAWRIWASALMNAKDFAQALSVRQQHAASNESLDEGLCWESMTAAAASQDWATVRANAALLELDIDPGVGVIDENWEEVLIAITEEDGREFSYRAQRTGPVTARFVEPTGARYAQRMQDWIVFDAAPLGPAPEDEEERKNFLFTYQHVHTLASGEFAKSWLLDGVWPGDDAYDVLRDDLWGKKWACWVVSNNEYFVSNPELGASAETSEETSEEDEQRLPGVLVFVATPKSVPARELHDTLKELTKDWEHPLCWRALAEHVGQDVGLHQLIEEKYEL